jgi:hypothetical protein
MWFPDFSMGAMPCLRRVACGFVFDVADAVGIQIVSSVWHIGKRNANIHEGGAVQVFYDVDDLSDPFFG